VGYLNVLKNHSPLLESDLNSDTLIEFQAEISLLFHEICYSKIQIIKKSVLNTDNYQFIYLCY
jgi:hypothetical protein